MNPLQQYGYTDRVARLFSLHLPSTGAPAASPARVVRADRTRLLLATEQGLLGVQAHESLVTGDWVAVSGGEDPRVVGVLPRWAVLRRKRAHDPLAEAQLLGANVDLVGVVVPLDRALSANRLERTLVAAWDSGAVPLVVLTKADLSSRFDAVVADTVERARGAEVFTTSAEDGDGLDDLRARVGAGRTLALLGPSGAGKSSLVNALVGRDVQDTGRVRLGDGRGRHTTTARELVPIGDGAVLMDTPGLRGSPSGTPRTDWPRSSARSRTCSPPAGSETARTMPNPGAPSSSPSCPGHSRSGGGGATGRCGRELDSLHRRQNPPERRSHDRSLERAVRDAVRGKEHRQGWGERRRRSAHRACSREEQQAGVEPPVGFEPTTPALQERCSGQLS